MTKKILIFIIGILAGFLVIIQWQNYQRIAQNVRGQQFDIHREISVLVANNANLKSEIMQLESQKLEYKNTYDIYQKSKDTINDYKIMAGEEDIKGAGAIVTISDIPTITQLTDLLNEIYQLGAEAVAINGIRMTNQTAGLASYNGQIVHNGQILIDPLEIKIIGDGSAIRKSLDRPDSILFRIQKTTPDMKISIAEGEVKIPKLTQ